MKSKKNVGLDDVSKNYLDIFLATVPSEDVSETQAAEMNIDSLEVLANKYKRLINLVKYSVEVDDPIRSGGSNRCPIETSANTAHNVPSTLAHTA